MKTPDEIKKGLYACGTDECHRQHTDCPYNNGHSEPCIMNVCGDALAYIEQLESRAEPKNRVLTLEELKARCEGGTDAAPLWYEDKDRSNVSRWMIIDLPKVPLGSTATVKCLVNSQFFEATYGKEWRCWLRKPTEEELRRTPWGGEGHV